MPSPFILLPCHSKAAPAACLLFCFLSAWLAAGRQALAEPVIQNVSPRGLVIGGETVLTVEGSQLAAEPRLILQIPGAEATLEGDPQENRATFRVRLPRSAQAGHYPVRVAGRTGLSAPATVGVDVLPEGPWAEQIDSLPTAMTGQLTGNQLLETTFQGYQGQPIVIDVEAQRLGSGLRPVVRLLDDRATQIAWSTDVESAGGDARLDIVLPADGTYTIQLHDRMYKGAGPGHFRLKVGNFRYADLAFPPAVSPGQEVAIEYLGAQASSIAWDGLEGSVSKLVEVSLDDRPFSGPRPKVLVSDFPEVVEQDASSGDPQILPPAPVAVSGRLLQPGERDRYLVPVTAGDKVVAQVLAEAMGSSLDAVLDVHAEDGRHLGSNDDAPDSVDPRLEFDVPADVERVIFTVRSLHDEAGPLKVYRLVVKPRSASQARLRTEAQLINLPAQGQATFRVTAQRQNLPGPIELTLPQLPAGIQASGTVIPAGAEHTLVTLTATEPAEEVAIGPILATAETPQGGGHRSAVSVGGGSWTAARGPGETDLAIGINHAPGIAIDWEDQPENLKFNLGATVPLKVAVRRGEGVSGKVRLTLLTSQTMPRTEGPDPNNPNNKIEVDDLEKALHLPEAVVLEPDQTEAQVHLQVPAELADIPWDIAIVGELLSEDEKNVTAQAATPARRYTVASPVYVHFDDGPANPLKGKITRAAGFEGEVRVQLVELPEGIESPEVTVAADQTEFSLELSVPEDFDFAQLSQTKAIATTTRDGAEVQSEPVPVPVEKTENPEP